MSKRDEGVNSKLPILISMGEPAGIGPEVAVKSWIALKGEIEGRALRLVGVPDIFRDAAKALAGEADLPFSSFVDTGHRVRSSAGRPLPDHADAVTGAVAESVRACLRGEAAGLVTAPIQKSTLTAAGFGFPGHTEYLAHLTGVERPVMMLADDTLSPPLRVVPLTIHVPLRDVFGKLSAAGLMATARIVLDALKRDFACEAPRLAIAGLNPHAGEDGTMGMEEFEILSPAASLLRQEGHRILGPLPADTLFHTEARRSYDAALCMYHDQALIPIKTLAFWTGVNVTLGLPIVRTSPDHGTALDIAGRGIAHEASMIAAIRLAADIAARRGL